MTFLLRKLDKRTRWNKEEAKKKYSWLLSEEIPSDCLRELETDSCTLSFWIVKEDKSNLNRLLAALAANRQTLAEIDFGLIDFEVIRSADFNLEKIPGDTADYEANDWHVDISQLSVQKLVNLAELLWKGMVTERRTRKQILDSMVESIQANYLDLAKINTKSDDLDARLNS